jgi:hypothetical protein
MAKSTIHIIHSILSGAFDAAQRWEWIDRNPADSAKPENPSLRNVVLLDGAAFAGLIDRGQVPADAPDSTAARQFAACDVPTTTPDAPIPGVLAAMDAGQLSRLVVLDADGRTVAGLVCLDHTSEGFCGG